MVSFISVMYMLSLQYFSSLYQGNTSPNLNMMLNTSHAQPEPHHIGASMRTKTFLCIQKKAHTAEPFLYVCGVCHMNFEGSLFFSDIGWIFSWVGAQLCCTWQHSGDEGALSLGRAPCGICGLWLSHTHRVPQQPGSHRKGLQRGTRGYDSTPEHWLEYRHGKNFFCFPRNLESKTFLLMIPNSSTRKEIQPWKVAFPIIWLKLLSWK